jgi:integrase
MSITSYNTKAGKRWRYRLYNPETGKTEGGQGGFATKRDARAAEAEAIAGGTLDPDTTTVARWHELWLGTCGVGESTLVHYTDRTKRFVAAYGEKPLGYVGRPLALEWYAKKGGGVPELSSMWTAAVAAGLAHENPFALLQKKHAKKIQPGWLVARDLRALIAAGYLVHEPVYGRVMEALITVGAYVGIRPGELAGLRWSDLNPDDQVLHVGQQANGRLKKMTPPKNGEERDVVYPQIAVDAIARMPKLHDELVFVSKSGAVLYAPNRNTIWAPVRAAAGRPRMRLHELRHYTATLLLEQGLSSADAATQLGHTDGGRLVEKTYGHPRRKPALDRVRTALAQATEDQAKEAAS